MTTCVLQQSQHPIVITTSLSSAPPCSPRLNVYSYPPLYSMANSIPTPAKVAGWYVGLTRGPNAELLHRVLSLSPPCVTTVFSTVPPPNSFSGLGRQTPNNHTPSPTIYNQPKTHNVSAGTESECEVRVSFSGESSMTSEYKATLYKGAHRFGTACSRESETRK
jgi:hypothetical protein